MEKPQCSSERSSETDDKQKNFFSYFCSKKSFSEALKNISDVCSHVETI